MAKLRKMNKDLKIQLTRIIVWNLYSLIHLPDGQALWICGHDVLLHDT